MALLVPKIQQHLTLFMIKANMALQGTAIQNHI
jgi:hypothetical protein